MRDGEYLQLERGKGQALADRLVGTLREEAEEVASGWRLQAISIDLDASGGRVALTADFVPGRLRLFISQGRVLRATYG